jgi:hypothetical protein
MSNIFTPPGTSQRNQQVNTQQNYMNQAAGLGPGLAGYLGQQQAFQTGQLPHMQQGVNNAYQYTTQGGRNDLANANNAWLQGAANQQAGQAGSMFAGNKALASGYALGAHNAANQGAAGYAAQVNSPPAMQNAWSNYMNAASAVAPNYGTLGAIAGSVYGSPQVPVGQGLGGVLGGLASPVLSGVEGAGGINPWLSSIFGGGSSGGGITPSSFQGYQNMTPWAGFQGF